MSFSLIERNLAAVSLSGRNDAALAAALDVNDNVQALSKRRHRDQPTLTVVFSPVLKKQRLIPIHAIEVAKIHSMVSEIFEPLFLVPCRRRFL
jgi:hypothetical protein